MTPETAVICAYNSRNPGMYTVDLSARSVFGPHGRLFQVEPLSRFGRLRYLRMRDVDSLRPFRHIVFWGDFQNNPVWGANDFAQRRVRQGAAAHLDGARREWVSLYLRTREWIGAGKTLLSIGSCFLGADADDHLRLYGDDLRYMLDSFDLIAPRDPLSTDVLRRLAPARSTAIVEGLDPVFLGSQLPVSDGPGSGRFGWYFHRSNIARTDELVGALARETGLRPRPLRWFGLKNDLFTHWKYHRRIRRLAGCDLVLTDVYHLAATCLKMRVPVLCIGRATALQTSTLSDLKKRGLFASLGAEADYLETAEGVVTPALVSSVRERATAILSRGGFDPAVGEALDAKAGAVRSRLRSALLR